MEENIVARDFMSDLIKNGGEKYNEYINFLNTERDKGESISKEVEEYLQKICDEGDCLLQGTSEDRRLINFSSGRKVDPFDEIKVFIETGSIYSSGNDTLLMIDYTIFFCEQEIESYAKCYRLFKPKILRLFDQMEHMVKVFEFKRDKI